MLVAVKTWALPHLLANGYADGMLLFGLFFASAVFYQSHRRQETRRHRSALDYVIDARRRDRAWGGDIDKSNCRNSKDEMEEMFQVPLALFQLLRVTQRTEGVLIRNGHANT